MRHDSDYIWSDDTMQSYCTEFYVNDIEIGNIVNPYDDCIDAGFGLERLDSLVNDKELLTDTNSLLLMGIRKKHGFILKKLFARFIDNDGEVSPNDSIYDIYIKEKERYEKIKAKYERMKDKPKFQNMSKEKWKDTFGIDLDLLS